MENFEVLVQNIEDAKSNNSKLVLPRKEQLENLDEYELESISESLTQIISSEDIDPSVKLSAVAYLHKLSHLPSIGHAFIIDSLVEATTCNDELVVREIFRSLLKIYNGTSDSYTKEKIQETFINNLYSMNPEIRELADQYLTFITDYRKYHDKEKLPKKLMDERVSQGSINDKDIMVRTSSIYVMYNELMSSSNQKQPTSSLIKQILMGTEDRSYKVREAAVTVLGELVSKTSGTLRDEIAKALLERTEDEYSIVRKCALQSLVKVASYILDEELKKQVAEKILENLYYIDPSIKNVAFKFLANNEFSDLDLQRRIVYCFKNVVEGWDPTHIRENAAKHLYEKFNTISDPDLQNEILGVFYKLFFDGSRKLRRAGADYLTNLALNSSNQAFVRKIVDYFVEGEDRGNLLTRYSMEYLVKIALNSSDLETREKVTQMLLRKTIDKDFIIRNTALDLLNEMILTISNQDLNKMILQGIISNLNDKHWGTRKALVGFLGRVTLNISDPNLQDKLVQTIIEKRIDRDLRVRKAADAALYDILPHVSEDLRKRIESVLLYLGKRTPSTVGKDVLSDHRDVFKPKKEQRTNKKALRR